MTYVLPQTPVSLRTDVDADPLVEEMVQRLRAGLSDLVALDEWRRPVPWHGVVRLALGPVLGRLRDAQTASALAHALLETPIPAPAGEVWTPMMPAGSAPTVVQPSGPDALAEESRSGLGWA